MIYAQSGYTESGIVDMVDLRLSLFGSKELSKSVEAVYGSWHILCACSVAQQFLHFFLSDVHIYEPNRDFAGYINKFDLHPRLSIAFFKLPKSLYIDWITSYLLQSSKLLDLS